MKSRINWFLHLGSIYYLRLSRMSTHKMQCEFAQYLKKGPTVGESNTWITQKLRCGTTGAYAFTTLGGTLGLRGGPIFAKSLNTLS